MSLDSQAAYLGLGLTDVIITRLGQVTDIDVRPTSSVVRYTEREVDPLEAAQELGVDTVLSGRLTKSAERVRVTVQLVNVETRSLLWADKLDLNPADLFTYEDLIAEHVVRTLELKLSSDQFSRLTKRHTHSNEAYEWYLRGRYYLSKRTPNSFQQAINSFEEATSADPNYALAHAGLSKCYSLLNYYGALRPEVSGPKAKEAAERALEADEALAEGHTATALVAFWYEWDWLRAQFEFERAIALNPGCSSVYQWYGCYLAAMREFEKAAEIGERALKLDPLIPSVNQASGMINYYSRRYDEAIRHCERALSLDSGFIPALFFLGQSYMQQGAFDRAIECYERGMKSFGKLPMGAAVVAYAHAVAGDKSVAEETLRRLDELSDSGETYVPAFAMALVHAGLDNKDRALYWLEKAYEERFIWLVYIDVDPVFDNLREEQRFKQLVKRMQFRGEILDRWQRLEELFHAAIDRSAHERANFIAEECQGDEGLRRELESMIAHYEQAGGFIESPAYTFAAEAVLSGESDGALVGKIVGPYQILEVLDSGGMGVVYLAFDQELRRKAALKFLHHSLTGDQTKVLRFRHEARAASGLNHPNILTVFAIGNHQGRHYIATELVEGETLRERIKRGPLKLSDALDIALETASALSIAHASGIMHRDIKPENVMVRNDGYVKVLDFGLAKLIEPSAKHSELSTFINTEQGAVMGTVHYMSPEQVRGLAVDARTDIWSLGLVLYEMVTGYRAFEGATTSDVIVSILERQPPPLTDYCQGLPERLQTIVNGTLAKDLSHRYQTMKDLLEDLKYLRRDLEFKHIKANADPNENVLCT